MFGVVAAEQVALPSAMPRCPWATTEPNISYHDEEWGVPQHDDRVLFEFLILEGAQAGLSWSTILNKRDNYRRAFDHFDARKVAKYDARKVRKLLGDAGIVRNRLKIASAIQNARAFHHVPFVTPRPIRLARIFQGRGGTRPYHFLPKSKQTNASSLRK